jgi:hypothetical protein
VRWCEERRRPERRSVGDGRERLFPQQAPRLSRCSSHRLTKKKNSSNSGDERHGANSSGILAFFTLKWNRQLYNGEHRGYLWAGELASTCGRRAQRAGPAQP